MSMTLKRLKTTNRIQHQNEACTFNIIAFNSCLFNLYAEYSMQNAWLDKSQAGIKIARRNINNFRYANDITLMAESKEQKSVLMKVKEEREKASLKLNIQKTKIIISGPITS